MHIGVVNGIEDREEYKSEASDDTEHHGSDVQIGFMLSERARNPPDVVEPTLSEQSSSPEEASQGIADDKKGLVFSSDIADLLT